MLEPMNISPTAAVISPEAIKTQKPIEQKSQNHSRLTQRGDQILTLATSGLSNKEIAKLCRISPRTVEQH